MKTAITHKNTLLHFAQNIAATKKCNRVFLSPSQEKLKNKKFPSLQKNKTSLPHSQRQTDPMTVYSLMQIACATNERIRAACNSVYVAIAGEVVNRRSVLLINFVLNGKESASNPLLHIHANR